ncbi:TetR/AcrR family transcriptional regulator [Fusibacter tunisiensis]|uniref:AcrR family transcriptional regulator n=1 Tax=Fusibacter tunisiensis TaxID=1008308 RepID=A0ABS2MPW8_9FIRM|nr:TetR/AcrR family transcriptional regulator [Fusibacter tunisiensis]MBM7561434.1 AcrR family transcriptional regulator [Fusibacter tunisiensis]
MYHTGKPNFKNKSKEKLYCALLEMVQVKSYDKIAVEKLAKKAGVSRSTFYRHYQRIDEILLEAIDQEIVSYSRCLMDFSSAGNFNLPFPLNLMEVSIEFWTKHYELVDCLIRIDRVQWLYSKLLEMDVSENFDDSRLNRLEKIDSMYVKRIGAVILVETLNYWIKNGRSKSPCDLTNLLISSFGDGGKTDP